MMATDDLAPGHAENSVDPLVALIRERGTGVVKDHRVVRLPANRPPWTATGIKLGSGDRISLFCSGRAWLETNPAAWVGAHFGLWVRTNAHGPIFRGSRRSSLTFTVEAEGELQLANIFPGAWADRTGVLASSARIYDRVAGGFEVLVILWQVDPREGLMRLCADGGPVGNEF